MTKYPPVIPDLVRNPWSGPRGELGLTPIVRVSVPMDSRVKPENDNKEKRFFLLFFTFWTGKHPLGR